MSRDAVLKDLFKAKHQREHVGKYEHFIHKFLVEIGPVYDENFLQMRAARINPNKTKEWKMYCRREVTLNELSKQMRKALSLHVLGACTKKVSKYE